jgi:serine/threonine-protein kinase
MTDPNLGRLLSKRYQLNELLGQGAMGRVYGAKDTLLGGVPVAVKFLAQTLLNQKMRDRFEREAMTCASLGQRSIHIVRVTDYGVDEDEIPYYVMEYLRGESLFHLISREPLTLPRFLNLSRQICLGLQCAHQGISIEGEICPVVHRDIKPNNIIICPDDSLGELAKILDFGIAKMLQADNEATNCFMGTLAYSSPEQMEGHELDARSDIYSLGVMMYQMLTGKMPVQADTHTFGGWYKAHHHQQPRSFEHANANVKIPKPLETLVMSCLAKSPNDRPTTTAEILKALEPLEERFRTGRQLAGRIEDVLKEKHILPGISQARDLTSPDQVCLQATWPNTKPIAEIVFSNPVRTPKEMLATLWVMLKRQEIHRRQLCTRYNQFLFLLSPHPVILWLTVLYNQECGPRWLPCYLDLKTAQGQQMTRLLGQSGGYRILYFATEESQHCANVQPVSIAPAQCKLLLQWSTLAQTSPSTANFTQSKNQLKMELENIKPRILMKLESLYKKSS